MQYVIVGIDETFEGFDLTCEGEYVAEKGNPSIAGVYGVFKTLKEAEEYMPLVEENGCTLFIAPLVDKDLYPLNQKNKDLFSK